MKIFLLQSNVADIMGKSFKTKFALYFVLLALIIPILASAENVIFQKPVIVGMNLSIIDDTYSIRGTNNPDKIILRNDNERIDLEVNETTQTKNYKFEVITRLFEWDKIGEKDSEGVPLYGTIHEKTDEILYTYWIKVTLLKPIVEFKHEFSTNNFELFKPFNITTTIENLGAYEVDVKFSEFLHKDLKINRIITPNKSVKVVDNDDETYNQAITIEDELDSELKLIYEVIPLKPLTQDFNSKATYVYEDLKYNVKEKEETQIEIIPNIIYNSGIFNEKYYVIKNWPVEVGDVKKYGVKITNQGNSLSETINLLIQFNDNFDVTIKKGDNELTLFDDSFEEEINLKPDESRTFVFDIFPTRTGESNISATVSYTVNNNLITGTEITTIQGEKEPLVPKIIFNTSRENESADTILYVVNPNKRSFTKDLVVKIRTKFGREYDEYDYTFPQENIESSLLINKLNPYVYNSTGDYIEIEGEFKTEFDEVIKFKKKVSPKEGFSSDFYSISGAISNENYLDLRHEEEMAMFDRKRPLSLSERMQNFGKSISRSQNESKNNYLIPVAIGGILIMIQIMQFLKQNKRKGN